jgi:hypothetical protein
MTVVGSEEKYDLEEDDQGVLHLACLLGSRINGKSISDAVSSPRNSLLTVNEADWPTALKTISTVDNI